MTDSGRPSPRVLVITGEGGPAPAEVAVATALQCAALGHRTLLTSMDDREALEDLVSVRAPAPRAGQDQRRTRVGELLWLDGALPNSVRDVAAPLGDWLRGLLDRREAGTPPLDVRMLPGWEQLAGALAVVAAVRSGAYDVIVVHGPHGRDLIRFAVLADAVRWWLERAAPDEPALSRLARPLLRRYAGLPVPDDETLASVRTLAADIAGVHGLFSDSAACSVRWVMAGSAAALRRARRSLAGLALMEYPVDLVIVDTTGARGETDGDGRFDDELAPYLVRRRTRTLPYRADPEHYLALGAEIHAGGDPALPCLTREAAPVRRSDGVWEMTISAPFADAGDISVVDGAHGLSVGIGPWWRMVRLPAALAGFVCRRADHDGSALRLTFTPED
jgi:arsenite/tail-anchored protein-transporting ATPase